MNAADARKNIDLAYGALGEAKNNLGVPTPDYPAPVADAVDRITYARKRLVAAKNALAEAPTPEPVRKLLKGAIVVNAVNANVDLLRQAGVTHVAVEATPANMQDFATTRWDGFERGWFVVSRGNDGDAIADALATTARVVSFAVVDTESHKTDMGGSRAWTDTLYAALRSKLGPTYPLYNITFGVHSSPAVVNHLAFQRYDVTPIWEAYDGDGRTLGAAVTANKALQEGWARPHVALGDKSLPADVAELKGTNVLGGVWLWAPEQAGASVLALKALG